MTTLELANAVAALCRESRFAEVQDMYWSPGIVAIEAMDGPMARLEGRAAVQPKLDWWNANHEVHGTTIEGPFVCHDEFALVMELDVTPKGGTRTTMREIIGYKTREGKIVEERYFYSM